MGAARMMRGAALVAALVSALLLLVATLGIMPSRSLDSSYYDESESSSLRRNRRVLNLDAFADPKSVEGRSQESQDASNVLSQMKAFEEQRGITSRGAGDSSYDPTMTLSSGSGIDVGNLQAGADKQLDEMKMMQQGQSNAADGLLYQPIKFEERPVSRNVLGTIYAPTLHDKNFSLYEQDYRSAIEDWVVMMHGAGQPLLHSFEYIPSETETYYAVWGWQRGRIEGSAWRVGGSQAEYLDVYSYVDPRGYDLESVPVLAVDGDHAAFHGWHPAAYGHVLDYHLSQVAFLKSQVHDECRFLFVEGSLKDILLYIDPAFYERVTWLKKGQIAKINGNLLMGFHEVSARKEFPRFGANGWLQSWLGTLQYHVPKDSRKIIYHTRVPPQAQHGRIVDTEHNNDIFALIQRKMAQHGREEELVVFDGTTAGDDGLSRLMTPFEQFQLFRSATSVIGCHGTGLANMVWMDHTTGETPKIVEFTAGPSSRNDPNLKHHTFRNYIWNYWGMPYDYNHILYTPNSTDARLFIDLEILNSVLDKIWG